ncbi:MAG: hypothetical protein OEM19_06905 [Deltaproteobacteria bacterium]|nr:hypothetical protein [Deltaproteobacteria bacterium]
MAKKKAGTTKQGASAPSTEEVVPIPPIEEEIPPTLNPREAAIEAVGRRRNEEINEELEEGGSEHRIALDAPSPPEETPEELPPEELPPEEPPPEELPPENVDKTLASSEKVEQTLDEGQVIDPTAHSKERLVSVTMDDGAVIQIPESSIQTTIKVDGETSGITLDQMRRDHQKSATASKRLSEAATRKKDLDAREKVIEEREKQPPQGAAAALPVNADVQERAGAIVKKLYSGDPDDAQNAIVEIITAQTPATPPATPDISVDQIASDVERKLELKQAGKKFSTEFQDIVSDDFLMARADAFHEEVLLEDPDIDPEAGFTEAGRRTREWIANKAGKEVTPEPTPPSEVTPVITASNMNTRRERKATTVQSIPTAKKVAGLGKVAEPSPTHSDVIAEIKKSRGQAT